MCIVVWTDKIVSHVAKVLSTSVLAFLLFVGLISDGVMGGTKNELQLCVGMSS